ncbi:MAG: hypothetical protein ACD_62C00305G0002 [uncultured bacterium]|nr:MAG: hypothetical protein ACD_62C00305G0002 [uncultured bacterium]
MSGIGVVLNPFSKKYKKNPGKLEHMAFIIGDKASCRPTEDLDDLYRVVEAFKSREIDIVAISGGDGTIHCTLSAFLKIYGEKPLPKVTLLRGGTLNTIAATLGIRGSTEQLMSELLVKYHEDKNFEIRKLRLTKINDSYGCIFGMGVIYNFMEEYYKNPEVNPFIAGKTLVASLLSGVVQGKTIKRMFKRFDADVFVDGVKWPFANYSALFTGSIRQLGLEFNVFRHMLTQNEKICAMGISANAGDLMPYLLNLREGKASGSPDVLDAAVDKMEIYLKEPLPYTIDGDMLPAIDKFIITAGPEVSVLV